jgi:hypothetical protein
MVINTKSIFIKENQVIYRIYNLRTTGPISMSSDLLDSSPYKNKNNSNLGKNTDNYLDKKKFYLR